MSVNLFRHRVSITVGLVVLFVVVLVLWSAPFSSRVGAQQATEIIPNIPSIAPGAAYRQTNLMSDWPGLAPIQDPLLVNPWGLTATAASPFWVANNGTSTTQLIRGDVGGAPLVLNASPQTVNIPGGLPTGVVANGTSDFQIPPPGGGAPAVSAFIFDSITGNITAWNGASGAAAQNMVSMPGHVWTGLAIGAAAGGNRLYAADFANNHIDVFNGTFTATTVPGGFIDATIPVGYAPFNIQNLGGLLYVTYAKVDPMTGLSVDGVGLGLLRRFNTDGVRDLTFGINDVSTNPTSQLNAPWGLTIAPASFGIFGGALIVGNFGEGNPSMHAYNPSTGAALGADNSLKGESGQGIVIDELWALRFGNGGNGGDVNTMYFTAGIGEEEHGLFGKLNPTTATATSLVQFGSDTYAIGEGSGHIDITVTRGGDASGNASVNVSTFDESQLDHGSQKSDYELAVQKVNFAPGETSKTVRILIVNDTFDENDEEVDLYLSNPIGTGVGLGSPNTAKLTIIDNDTGAPATNVVDDTTFFVRQNYLDFLNREPDPSGLAFWVNNIDSCGSDAQCRAVKRIDTSAAFFLSNEFQKTGLIAYLANRAAFGTSASGSPAPVLYGEFEKESQQLQQNLVFGQPGFDAQLDANKVAYFNDFVNRPEFVSKFSSMSNTAYVDSLLTTAGIDPANVRLMTATLTNSQEVPPTTPTTSTGAARPASSGTARFLFNSASSPTAMTFTATINNIDVTGSQTTDTNDNLVAAHIHAGASVAPGVNGPVVWGFFGSPFNDNNPNDAANTPFSSGVGGTFSGKWDAPEGNGTTLAAQLTNLRTGHAYINFHTTQFGGGEIRGNIPDVGAFRQSLIDGLNASTMTRAQVLRAVAESEEFALNETNRAFVTMEYFGYLRRDPDTAGFNFWLNKLNAFNGNFQQAEMVKAFISAAEYRQRFGPS